MPMLLSDIWSRSVSDIPVDLDLFQTFLSVDVSKTIDPLTHL